MEGLQFINISKSFDGVPAVHNVSFDVAQGDTIALLGPSGCGKSTILAIIAGLETPDLGIVRWNGQDLAELPAHKRGFGLMFQDFALFPHMNVFQNIAFGLRMQGEPQEQVRRRVRDVLELVGLPGYERRDVNTLSGGEQQRIALARALAPRPKLLMLDEPLGSLDRNLRERLVAELDEILNSIDQTTLYVTHDQEEAFALADRIVLMNAGRVEQNATPEHLYREPASVFAAQFIGLSNIFPGEISQEGKNKYLHTGLGTIPIETGHIGMVTVLLRPENLHIGTGWPFQLSGKLIKCTFQGANCQALVEVNGVTLKLMNPSGTSLPPANENILIGFIPQETIQIFPPNA